MTNLDMTDAPSGSDCTVGLTINDLPSETIINILNMMDIDSLLVAVEVCVRWQQLCKTPYIWKYKNFQVHQTNYVEISEKIVPVAANHFKKVMLYDMNALQTARFSACLISYCPNLTHLEINTEIDSSMFDDLHHWPNLKFLSFEGSKIVNLRGAGRNSTYNLPFKKLKYLETLILSDFSLTRNSLYSMLECQNLVIIGMELMRNIPEDFLESLLRIKQANLRALYIYGDTLNDDIMRHLFNCRLLQELWILTCDTLSDSSLLHLSRLKNLQSLELFSDDFLPSAI